MRCLRLAVPVVVATLGFIVPARALAQSDPSVPTVPDDSTTSTTSTSSTSTSSTTTSSTSLPFATTVPPPVVLPTGPIDGAAADPAGTPKFDVPTEPAATIPGPSGIPGGLAVVTAQLAPFQRKVADAISRLTFAQALVAGSQAELDAATSANSGTQAALDQLGSADRDAAETASTSRAKVVNTTVAAFMAGAGLDETLEILAGGSGQSDARIRLTYFDSILDRASTDAAALATERDRLDGQVQRAADDHAQSLVRLQTATTAHTDATAAFDRATADLAAARSEIDKANVDVVVTPSVVPDIPDRVMDAYVRAAQLTAVSNPACRIRWWGLAAIGQTESHHASGHAIGVDGTISPPIVGPALDGSHGFARINDTDGGRLDGDPVFDRAAGPMQFIPATWRTLGVDASGDGKADPQNIYDAAYSSARYLCAAARPFPMDTEAGFKKAAYSYSASATYPAISWDRSAVYRLIAAAAETGG